MPYSSTSSSLILTVVTLILASTVHAALPLIPTPKNSSYFSVINLFSYDQPLAIQANAVPGGPQNAQESFIQFYLNDQGEGKNGGAQIEWSPKDGQKAPINKTQNLEFDGHKHATLLSFEDPGSFAVNISHEFLVAPGIMQYRVGILNISTADPDWVCTTGSCRFKTMRWTTVPFTTTNMTVS
ncbi:MAG: hypothetical protein OHK93_005416 [Ramalina farinacea]|uniref:Uncharacterized protein n=1 Tax=Ramalina farinacea TaxID=258253 RepID=A0AA43QGN6_9LECA|nr:hypothetical protein [Ramalina farinacea]